MKIGPCAAKNCELRQIRKEAAVSKSLWVPQVNLIGANCLSIAWEGESEVGARSLKLYLVTKLKFMILREFISNFRLAY